MYNLECSKAYFVIVVENRTKIGPNWQNKLSDPGYSSRIAVRYPDSIEFQKYVELLLELRGSNDASILFTTRW